MFPMKTMSVAEAATLLKVSKSTALRMANRGELGPVERTSAGLILQRARVERKLPEPAEQG